MIVDIHTHIFPAEFAAQRERLLEGDPTFRALYAAQKATLATADDLLRSMDRAGIDVSVTVGFAWTDAETCRRHNDYLLETASTSDGRTVALCSLPLAAGPDAIAAEMTRCAAAGAKGFGELRPDNLGFDLLGPDGDRLAAVAGELGSLLMFHVSEPVGHTYPGKEGLSLGAFYHFATRHAGLRIVGAHWGGGLPFYAGMPEVRQAFQASLYIDTAASSLLYGDDVYEAGVALAGTERVLFGSDFPLLGQARSRRRIEESGLDEAAKPAVLGDNAAKLLDLALARQ